MRHRKHNQQLGVKKGHRQAILGNLASALFEHARIETTLVKAKALRPFAEKLITFAKKAQESSPERALYLRRLTISRIRNKGAAHVLFEERANEFVDRNGGYTRIYKLGRRIGDGAEMAIVELIGAADEGYQDSRKKSKKKSDGPSDERKALETVENESDNSETGVNVSDEETTPSTDDTGSVDEPEKPGAEK
ncbi:MAG: 50S ribosomal protein L17 [Candidatus Moanabacter tarae]|uniref:Large ribosomal subunit protein bL17 n=1 Tax=Candidatus Moanibacter tarae TaxID=2200854 RepID=A0A2Z4ADE1_9BACT|nr:MAG: 50S ribosomal protein L17 [Candidatus Moanabacter tarae]|tara:strand:+ start:19301 stop:19879 length:579 start_codon:yes stop_codon:yes gene_type:complete